MAVLNFSELSELYPNDDRFEKKYINRKLAVTFYQNERGAKPTDELSIGWDELMARLKQRYIRDNKSGSAFSGVRLFEGQRRSNENIQYVDMLVADIDTTGKKDAVTGRITEIIKAAPRFEDICDRFNDYEYFVYTTHGHDPDSGVYKYRIVFPLTRSVQPHEWDGVWEGFNNLLGGINDAATKDISRIFYMPSCPELYRGDAWYEQNEGEWIDPIDLIGTKPKGDSRSHQNTFSLEFSQKQKSSSLFALSNDLGGGKEYAPSSALQIIKFCPTLKEIADKKGDVSEPLWRAMIGVVKNCTEGYALIHEWSKGYTGYNQAETQRKIDKYNAGATTCTLFNNHSEKCVGCKHLSVIKSPIQLGVISKINNDIIETVGLDREMISEKLPRLASSDGMIIFSDTPPPPRVYVLQDLIAAVKVCVLAGLGGVSKTMMSMQWAVCVALGLPYMGKATLEGAVMLILGEEDCDEIARRFNAIVKIMDLSNAQKVLVQKRIRAFPMNGLDCRLTMKQGGSLESADFTAEVIEASKILEVESGMALSLIVLDHAGQIHGGEFNTREDVAQTMRQVNFIAQKTGAAVLVLAHSPKTAVGKDKADSNDVAGSAAWVDLARAVFVLRTMDEAEGKNFGVQSDVRKNYASLSVVKNNCGPTGDQFWFNRVTVDSHGVSVLNHVDLVKPIAPMKGGAKLQKLIIEKITEHTGGYSKTGFVEKYFGKDGPLNATKREVQVSLDELLGSGQLLLREPTTEERATHKLHQTIKEVLEVK
jgi:hypothetical protein